MASISIAVFAKTPNLTPAKTRLAAAIGSEQATRFYQHSLCCTTAILAQLKSQYSEVKVTWAVAEEEHKKDSLWQDKNTMWTGPGDLGQRLHQVYSHLKQDADIVIIIGSDCPHLSITAITDAIEKLHKQPQSVVIGPAEDGGFYLFASDRQIASTVWTQTRYSEATTRQQLILQLQQAVQFVEFTFDIDTINELRQLQQWFNQAATDILLAEQQQLQRWLQQLPI